MQKLLRNKTQLNTFKIIKMTHCLLSDHSRIKLEIYNKKIAGNSQTTWKLNNILLNNTRVKEEISRKNLKYFDLKEN